MTRYPPHATGRETDAFQVPGARRLLLLGFGAIFGLWMLSAYALASDMQEADGRSLAIRSRFLHNEQLLSTVRAQALLGAVYLRDALLDPAGSLHSADAKLREIRDTIDRALGDYVRRDGSAVEQDEWLRLQTELREYWQSFAPVLPAGAVQHLPASASYLHDEVIPKRETVIRISERIHALNRDAFEAEIAELAELRAGLRRRVWLTSLAAAAIGLGIAVFATRAAGRLESRLREQHANEVQHKQELERLSAKLLQAQEDERRRIARELHDEIGQSLSAIKLELAVAERAAGPGWERSLVEARSIAEKTLQSVREISQLLHPSMLDDLGLIDTATWYLRAFTRRTGIRTDLVVEQLDRRLAAPVEVCIYRVIQEAVTNVSRHAAATSCTVTIRRRETTLLLVVTDDGRGFEQDTTRPAEARGLGIVGLRERVAALGGSLRFETAVGHGTTLSVEVPQEPVH